MAEPRRLLRLQQLVLETIATTIQREVHDPRVRLVSVTRVVLAKDLSTAVIGWSTLGTPSEQRTVERGLADALPMIQRKVAGVMGTRVTPTLSLKFDRGLERAQRVEEIFRRLQAERGEAPVEATGAEAVAEATEEEPGDEPKVGPGEPPEDE